VRNVAKQARFFNAVFIEGATGDAKSTDEPQKISPLFLIFSHQNLTP
jgi:hypothetical protein